MMTTETVGGSAGRTAVVRTLARSGLVVGGAIVAANVLNAGFHFVVARLLEPADYSVLAVLLAAILVLGVPTSALQATVARKVAVALGEGDAATAGAVLRAAGAMALRVLPLLLAAAAVVGVPVALVGNVERFWPVAWTAVAIVAGTALPVVWGGLQGAQRFAWLAAGQLGHVVLKVALAVALAVAGAGLAGVTLGIALAAVATLALAGLPLRALWRAGAQHVARGPLFGAYGAAAAVGLSAFAALTTADLVVARLALDGETAGAYAAASVGARTLLILPSIVTTVVFARVATLGDPRRERRHLHAALLAVAGACLLGTVVLAAAPELAVRLAFGADYLRAADWLAPLAFAMTGYALAYVHLFHFLSLGRVRYVALPALALVAQLGAYAFLHDRPAELIGVQLGTAAALVLAGELFARRG